MLGLGLGLGSELGLGLGLGLGLALGAYPSQWKIGVVSAGTTVELLEDGTRIQTNPNGLSIEMRPGFWEKL